MQLKAFIVSSKLQLQHKAEKRNKMYLAFAVNVLICEKRIYEKE